MPIEALRERAAVLGVAERISWDLRFVPDSEVPGVFAQARVIALPYRWIEGSGILATALARGVPPVVTAVGTFPELCREYDLGAPVPPGDPAALAVRARAGADRCGGCGRARSPAWSELARSWPGSARPG